ncbi:MAG: hypothetical protein ACK5AZ_17755 [Bryobacteraceae bacterium]
MRACTLVAANLVLAAVCCAQPLLLRTIAGNDFVGDGLPAYAAALASPQGIAVDRGGAIYIADALDHRVRRIGADGVIRTIAGTGHAGFSGDGGPAVQARLRSPYGIALDGRGNLYIADLGNARIRRVAPDGTIATIAGGGRVPPGGDGDGGPATGARLDAPRDVAADAAGNVYFSDFYAHRVFRVSPAGVITTVAGNGKAGFSGDGASATLAQLAYPAGLALDLQGAILIADSGNRRIRRVSLGQIASISNGRSAMIFHRPTGVALGPSGEIRVADGEDPLDTSNQLGIEAYAASSLATDPHGVVYTVSRAKVYRHRGTARVLIAGGGQYGYSGDSGPAVEARLHWPSSVARDAEGNLYIADEKNHRIRMIDTAGRISTVAGNGTPGGGGDGALAIEAQLRWPRGVAVDSGGNLLIADTGNHRIRIVRSSGVIETIAGTGATGPDPGDGGPAIFATFSSPERVLAAPNGDVYVADTDNHRVRRISRFGNIVTVAGSGVAGSAGDQGAAWKALLNAPRGLALDGAGNLYIADTNNHRVRRVSPDGKIETVRNAIPGNLLLPFGVAVSGNGDLYIAEAGGHRVRRIRADGALEILAGDGYPGFSGDGAPAASSRLETPSDLLLDSDNNLLLVESGNHRLRKLMLGGGVIAPGGLGVLTVANAASGVEGTVVPGGLVRIYWRSAPPAGALKAVFDGVAGAILDVSPEGVVVHVPEYLDNRSFVRVTLLRGDEVIAETSAALEEAAPGLFASRGVVAAVQEDGTLVSEEHPARRGSIVSIFATGTGAPHRALPVSVTIGGQEAELLYAGEAPGLVGILQVNLRIPGGYLPAGPLPVVLTAGTAASQPDVRIPIR